MTRSTARKITLAMQILFGAGLGFLIVGNIVGSFVAGALAYAIVVSFPRPLKDFSLASLRESLRVEWRFWCLVLGLVGLLVLHLVWHLTQVDIVMDAFRGAFVGVIFGEVLGKLVGDLAKDDAPPADKQDGGKN